MPTLYLALLALAAPLAASAMSCNIDNSCYPLTCSSSSQYCCSLNSNNCYTQCCNTYNDDDFPFFVWSPGIIAAVAICNLVFWGFVIWFSCRYYRRRQVSYVVMASNPPAPYQQTTTVVSHAPPGYQQAPPGYHQAPPVYSS